MMKAPFIGLAVALAVFAGLAPVVTQDAFFTSRGTAAAADPVTVPDVPAAGTPTASAAQSPEPADFFGFDLASLAAPPPSGRLDDLLRVPESPEITIAPSVSTEVLSSQSIRKIGYGRVSTVRVVTTSTGTYTSDGIASPHILYPGIDTAPPPKAGFGALFGLIGGNWVPLTLGRAGSFIVHGGRDGTSYISNGQATCIAGRGYYGCL